MYVQLSGVPHISKEEMTEVDKLLAENAGRNPEKPAKNIFFKNDIQEK